MKGHSRIGPLLASGARMIEADLVGNLKIVEHAPLKTDHFRDTRFLNPLGRLQIFLYPQFNNLPPLFHQDTRESTLT